jgi:hypothetical protein
VATVKRSNLRRVTPLQNSTSLARRTPMRRATQPLKRAPLVASRPKAKLTPMQKAPLLVRSGGWCELRVSASLCMGRAHDVAHRLGEGMGGRHGAAAVLNDRLSNVLHSCRACHDWCGREPFLARWAGWMLRTGDDPLTYPVLYAGREGRWLLDDEGGVTRLAQSGEVS